MSSCRRNVDVPSSTECNIVRTYWTSLQHSDLVPANTPNRTWSGTKMVRCSQSNSQGSRATSGSPWWSIRVPRSSEPTGQKRMRKALRCDRRPESAREQEVPQRRHSFCGQRRIGHRGDSKSTSVVRKWLMKMESLDTAIWTGLPGASDRRSAINIWRASKTKLDWQRRENLCGWRLLRTGQRCGLRCGKEEAEESIVETKRRTAPAGVVG